MTGGQGNWIIGLLVASLLLHVLTLAGVGGVSQMIWKIYLIWRRGRQ